MSKNGREERANVSGHIRADIAEAIKKAAHKRGITVSQWVAHAVEAQLDKEGGLPHQVSADELRITKIHELGLEADVDELIAMHANKEVAS